MIITGISSRRTSGIVWQVNCDTVQSMTPPCERRSVPGERAAGRAGAGQGHGPDQEGVQPARPPGAQDLPALQRHPAGQAAEGRQGIGGITPSPPHGYYLPEAETDMKGRLNAKLCVSLLSPLLLLSLLSPGGLQQCGELLWRELKDDSPVCVLPRVREVHQSLQGEQRAPFLSLSLSLSLSLQYILVLAALAVPVCYSLNRSVMLSLHHCSSSPITLQLLLSI